MPFTDEVFLSLVVAAFAIFGVVLAYASRVQR